MSYDILQYHRTLARLIDASSPFVVVTQTAIRGSAPQIAGAKAVVTSEGLECGTVGGGRIEAAAIRKARELLMAPDSGSCLTLTWNLQTDIGMTCGGEVSLLFEVHRPDSWPVAVFGAGHIAQSFVPLLCTLQCRITCVDPRQEWLNRIPDHPRLNKVCVPEPRELVSGFPADTWFVLISKGHATDLPVLQEILTTREPPFTGVIGSRLKARALRRDLTSAGIPQDRIDSFHCPLGLPIGNNTPPEIAVSIAAQLLQVRDSLVPS